MVTTGFWDLGGSRWLDVVISRAFPEEFRRDVVAVARILASGFRPNFCKADSDATTRAAAPSESCEALPAVTVPSGRNAGFNFANPSAVESARMPSSRATVAFAA